jgi:hypothetical protein
MTTTEEERQQDRIFFIGVCFNKYVYNWIERNGPDFDERTFDFATAGINHELTDERGENPLTESEQQMIIRFLNRLEEIHGPEEEERIDWNHLIRK